MAKRSDALLAALEQELHRGSTECALLALDALEAFLGEHPESQAVHAFAKRVQLSKPSMAVVQHIAWRVAKANLAEAKELIESLRERVKVAVQGVAQHACALLPQGGRVLTHSFSGTVFQALSLLSREAHLEVVVTESRPRCEGVLLAKELSSKEIPVTVVTDAAGATQLKECNALWVGADAVAKSSFVNKVGTLSLVLAARHFETPVQLLADSLKQLPSQVAYSDEPDHPLSEVLDEEIPGVAVRNPYFEEIPLNLVDRIVTE